MAEIQQTGPQGTVDIATEGSRESAVWDNVRRTTILTCTSHPTGVLVSLQLH